MALALNMDSITVLSATVIATGLNIYLYWWKREIV